MIRVTRGAEPETLKAERLVRLPAMRTIAATSAPTSSQFDGYRVAKATMDAIHGAKCWYCEKRFEGKYEPVEHYRPKTRANRGAGHPTHGYWWLAWTWENLLFVCDDCNKHKGTRFPLTSTSVALSAEQQPPMGESVLLIDPCDASLDPIDLIEFKRVRAVGIERWVPMPRVRDARAGETIEVLGLDGLNRPGVLDLYRDHVNQRVRPHVDKVRAALDAEDPRAIVATWHRACRGLLRGAHLYAALSHDALAVLVSPQERARWRLTLPRPPYLL